MGTGKRRFLWFLTALFLVTGISQFGRGNAVAGLLYLLTALLDAPVGPLNELAGVWRVLRWVLAVVLFLMAGVAVTMVGR